MFFSVASSTSSKYDPDVIRSEIKEIKDRVGQLRSGQRQTEFDLQNKQRGLMALKR